MLVKFKVTILLLCVFPGTIFPSSFFYFKSFHTSQVIDCFYNYHANMYQQVAPVIIIIII